jgi:Ca-activated chloride channel homolog
MSASKRLVTAMLAALSLLASAAAQDAPALRAPEDEVVKVEVDLVTVNVSVTHGGKRPVTGLRAADFLVSDEGREVSLEFFEGQGPSSIVFVVDTSTSMKYDKWRKLTAGLKKFLGSARDGNDYTLVAFSDRPRLVAEAVGAEELWQSALSLEPSGNTALYDAVLLGLEALGRAPRRHKALVLLTDGQDNSSRAQLDDVQREALARRATVYAVGINLYGFNDKAILDVELNGRDILNRLAAATGGLAFFPVPDEIRGVLDGINSDLSGQYTLGYYAPDKAPGWRNIQVSLSPTPRPFRLRYPQRYLKR